ncbi:hypothetical protein V1505DRAFT_378060 [Lipomyces doorenjongii]
MRQSECTYGGDLTDTFHTGKKNEDTSATGALPQSMVGRLGEDYLAEDRMTRLELKVEELQEMVLALVSEVRTRSESPRRRSSSDGADGMPKDGNNRLLEQRNGMLASRQGVLHFIGPTGWTIHRHGDQDVKALFHHQNGFENQWNAYLQIRDRYRGWRISSLLDSVTFAPTSRISNSELT